MPPKQSPPDPSIGSTAAFAFQLHQLRLTAGDPSFRVMAAKVHVAHTSLSRASQGQVFPTWEAAKGFVIACGAATDLETWQAKWEVAHIEVTQEKRRRKEQRRAADPEQGGQVSWFEAAGDDAPAADPVAALVVDLAAELAAGYAAARRSADFTAVMPVSVPVPAPLPPDMAPGTLAVDSPDENGEGVRLERMGDGQLRRVVVGNGHGRGAHRKTGVLSRIRNRRKRGQDGEWGNWAGIALAITTGALIVAPMTPIVWTWVP